MKLCHLLNEAILNLICTTVNEVASVKVCKILSSL